MSCVYIISLLLFVFSIASLMIRQLLHAGLTK